MGSACRIEGDLNGSGQELAKPAEKSFEKEGEIS
jgi:hypothetical protein